MNFQEIGRKVKLYYRPEQKDLIEGHGSEFNSSLEKAVALAFLDLKGNQSTVKKLLAENKGNLTWLMVKELGDLIPEIIPVLPLASHKWLMQILSGGEQYQEVEKISLVEIIGLYSQLSSAEQSVVVNKLTPDHKLVFSVELGDINSLQEEVITHPDPEGRYQELLSLSKTWGGKLPPLSSLMNQFPLANQMINDEDLKVVPEQVALEKEVLIKVFIQKLYQMNAKAFNYYEAINPYLSLDKIVKQMISDVVDQDLGDKFKWLGDNKFLNQDFTEVLIKNNAFNCLEYYLQDDKQLDKVVGIFFAFAEEQGMEVLFIEGMEKISQKHLSRLANLKNIQKIAVKSSSSTLDNFYAHIWDWLQGKLALSHFKSGKHSFAYHYPHFYRDLSELEQFHLFYSVQDFRNYFNQLKEMPKGREQEFLLGVAQIIFNRVRKINQTLKQDLDSKMNHQSQQVLTQNDMAVLSAYLEKLMVTEQCVQEIINRLSKSRFYDQDLNQLFDGDNKHGSFHQLKNLHLGELKIGGLENFQGHGKEIVDILKPLGLLLSPDIRKEVDHYVYVKSPDKVQINLVEDKNYKRILTNQGYHMWEVKNQKRKLDKVMDQVQNNDKINFEIKSSVMLNRGLTIKAQKTLTTDDFRAKAYSEAQGVLFNFSELDFLINETTQQLCLAMNRSENLSNFQKFLESDAFKALADSIVRIIATLEEDGDEEISSVKTQQYSQKSYQLMLASLKIIQTHLKDPAQYGRAIAKAFQGRYENIAKTRESQIEGKH